MGYVTRMEKQNFWSQYLKRRIHLGDTWAQMEKWGVEVWTELK